MEELVALCKRRGFIFQSNEIYGGLQGLYDFGPLGVELKKLVHPNSVLPLKVGNKIINQEIKDSVWGFIAVYVITVIIGTILLLGSGLNFETAFSAVFSCINNLGPALGDATFNYDSLNEISKLFLSFAMILGRLEIYTLLVLFTSFFWRS